VDERLDAILSFADIGEFVRQPIKTYSSGMFVRLAFAVAINVDPDILIIDEALAVGDSRFQLKCYRMLQLFQEQGKTILFVSHDLGSIKRLCTRAVLLEQGQLIAQGRPNPVVNIYTKLISDSGGLEAVRPDCEALARGEAEEEGGEAAEAGTCPADLEDADGEAAQARRLRLDERAHQQVSGGEYAYGGEQGRIRSVLVADSGGVPRTSFTTGEACTVSFVAQAVRDVREPIYAMTIKDAKGQEVYGVNTFFLNQPTEDVGAGESVLVTFAQDLNLMPGEYFISLGWTRFAGSDLSVVHRRYDAVKLEVLPTDRCFGVANCFSRITVRPC
jgi:hypothetical protein